MSDDTLSKLMNMASIYFLRSIVLLLLIKSDGKLLGVVYFVVVTFYYVRLKVYRYRKNHNGSL